MVFLVNSHDIWVNPIKGQAEFVKYCKLIPCTTPDLMLSGLIDINTC